MSTSTKISAASVWVSDVEGPAGATAAHSPHGGEKGQGERLVSRPRLMRALCAAKRS